MTVGPIEPVDPGPLRPGPLNPGLLSSGPLNPGPLNPGPLSPGPLSADAIERRLVEKVRLQAAAQARQERPPVPLPVQAPGAGASTASRIQPAQVLEEILASQDLQAIELAGDLVQDQVAQVAESAREVGVTEQILVSQSTRTARGPEPTRLTPQQEEQVEEIQALQDATSGTATREGGRSGVNVLI